MTVKYTVKEVLQFIEGNDVRFIRLVFFDISGRRKNLLIPASELKPAFEKGVPVSADAAGSGSGEILLFPEPDTLRMQDRLIRQGTAASLLCTLRCCDGAPFEGDVRRLLKNACERFRSSGLGAYISLSGDFTLLRRDNDGSPTGVYNDSAGYYDSYPDDRGENVIRQICLSLDETDIVPLSCRHGRGFGQHTVEMRFSEPFKAADEFQIFRSTAAECAAESGLYASFAPEDNNGLKISIALREAGENLFTDRGQGFSPKGKSFIAGILTHAAEISPFLTPCPASFGRLASGKSPAAVRLRDGAIMRMAMPGSARARLELLFADASADLYPALALLLAAGAEGLEKGLGIAEAEENARGLETELSSAVRVASDSTFVRRNIPPLILDGFISERS